MPNNRIVSDSLTDPCKPPAGLVRRASFGRISLLLVLFALATAGCNRATYRQRADNDVYGLVQCGSSDPRWSQPCYTIQVDTQSRMYDPHDPDCPPMPADDPTSHQLMHCVDGKRGYPCWDKCGLTATVENPAWRAFLPYDPQGRVVLDRQAAVELALLHSPTYQQQLENLYLSALDVSLQRFQFDLQFFGGNSTFFTKNGPLSGDASDSSKLSTATPIGVGRTFAAGGQFAADVANSIVWEFSGADGHNVTTPITLSLVQPLLRGAGREVVLEALTDSERALLANIRQLQRFHHGFYLQTVSGRNPGPGPSTGGLGVSSFAPGGGGGVGGFLSLLEEQLRIRNQKANVAGLRNSFDQVNEFYQVGRINRTQVDQIVQSLYSSQITLLSTTASYEDQLDTYKVSLGLPPQLEVQIEDPLLRPFNLIDPELIAIQEAVSSRLAELRNLEAEVDATIHPENLSEMTRQIISVIELIDHDIEKLRETLPSRRESLLRLAHREEFQRGDVDSGLVDTEDLDRRAAALEESLATLEPVLQATIGVAQYRAGDWHAAIDTIQESMQLRDGGNAVDWYYLAMAHWQLDQKELALEWFTKAADWTDAYERNDQRLARLRAEAADMIGLMDTLPEWVQELESGEDPANLKRQRLIRLLSLLSDQLGELSLVQAGVRLDTAMLVPIDLNPDVALEIARRNRLDWMNARAALVDRWRQVEVVANELKGFLDVSVEGTLTPNSNTIDTRHNTTGDITVGLAFDAPLNRREERNRYRAILINYQQARREYYTFEDRVAQALRDTLRSIRLSQLQFELQRAAVRTAINRVDQQFTELREVPKPGVEEFSLGATTARDLVDALNSLLNQQNSFLNNWVRYEVLRMDLDFDLGTMLLDERGMWLDPGPIDMSDGADLPELEEVPVPELALPLDLIEPGEPLPEAPDLFAPPPLPSP